MKNKVATPQVGQTIPLEKLQSACTDEWLVLPDLYAEGSLSRPFRLWPWHWDTFDFRLNWKAHGNDRQVPCSTICSPRRGNQWLQSHPALREVHSNGFWESTVIVSSFLISQNDSLEHGGRKWREGGKKSVTRRDVSFYLDSIYYFLTGLPWASHITSLWASIISSARPEDNDTWRAILTGKSGEGKVVHTYKGWASQPCDCSVKSLTYTFLSYVFIPLSILQ